MRLVFWLTLGILTFASTALADPMAVNPVSLQRLSTTKLAFTSNRGQWRNRVLYQARTGGMTIWFTQDGVTYQSSRAVERLNGLNPVDHDPLDPAKSRRCSGDSIETQVIRSYFVDANSNPVVVGEEETESRCNYFFGNDSTQWRTDVPNYNRIVYRELYPGIDLAFYGRDGAVEYDFIVHPGGNPSEIALRYEGVQSTVIDQSGNLVLVTPWGELIHRTPSLYSILPDGQRSPVAGSFCASEDGTIRFDIPEPIGQSLELVIDPVLEYSTCLGGVQSDFGYGIAVLGRGNAYVGGYTPSSDFPVVAPYQTDQGKYDAFITKLNSSGGVVYSTYLGGSEEDEGSRLAVDTAGNAYLTGYTFSSDFPTLGPCQTDQPSNDAFVTKLNPSGNALVYSTYLGGSGFDYGMGIAVDANGNACVTGWTASTDFPTVNAYQTDNPNFDVFVSKLNADGDSLVYSTYLGGNQADEGFGIAVDEVGNAYVTGKTFSDNFPTVGAYQTDQPGADAFVTKLTSAGGVVYSTYLGGAGQDDATAIAVDKGNAYVTGSTYSADFPTVGPYQTFQGSAGSPDAYASKLNSAGNGLVYSTCLGGTGIDAGEGIAVDGSGYAYILGVTYSTNFPLLDSYQEKAAVADVFVTKLNATGDDLVYSTLLGGRDADDGGQIAVDASGYAYITGSTNSIDFPTVNPYQTYQSAHDVFVARLGATVVDVFEPQSPVPPPTSDLWQNVPNPFNASTTIRFSLNTGGDVELGIFNLLGQRIRIHHERRVSPGSYTYEWDGTDETGRPMPSGIYLYRLTTSTFSKTLKMSLLK